MNDSNELELLAKEINAMSGYQYCSFTQRTIVGASGAVSTCYFAEINYTTVAFEGLQIHELRNECIKHLAKYTNRRERDIEELKAKAKELGIKPEELL